MIDRQAIAHAHTLAIPLLEQAGHQDAAEVLRVQGPELLRAVWRGEHDAHPTEDLAPQSVDPKAETDLIPRTFIETR